MENQKSPPVAAKTPFSRYLWQLAAVALVAVAGWLVWGIGRYWQRLLRQPQHTPPLPIVPPTVRAEIETGALQIATDNLRSGIERRLVATGEEKWVLCAGLRNFREPWARDFSFAVHGLLELGETEVVKECLELFLHYQKPDGQFPVKIHSTGQLDRYLHSLFGRHQPTHAPLHPKYLTGHNTTSLDGNGLLLIAALYYIKRTGDELFGRAQWQALKNGLLWMETHATHDEDLLHQDIFTDWADSIARPGHILYTNVIYWKALHELAEVAGKLGAFAEQQSYQLKAERVKQAINGHFWDDNLGYFITSHQFKMLNSDGNLLAIAWGLANASQSHHILDNMARFNMADPVPTQVTHLAYPRQYIALENWLAGISHYHTHAAWMWLGAWHVIALARMERVAEAEMLLFRLGRVIVQDGVVHEVYGLNGRHLSTRWYRSEAPLTWNAGMLVHAWHVLQRHQAGG